MQLNSAASSLGHGCAVGGSFEPDDGYEGYVPRIGRHTLHRNAMQGYVARLARKEAMALARSLRREDIALARMSEPGDVFLAPQSIGFLRRHPRYWTQGDRDTFIALRDERMMIEAVMRHTGSNDGRGQVISAPSSVNAANTSHASKRQHVADSFDARTAKERGKVRPYSKRQLALDIERNMRTPRTWIGADGQPVDTTCYSISADGTRTVFSTPEAERKERAKVQSARALKRDRRLAIVGPQRD